MITKKSAGVCKMKRVAVIDGDSIAYMAGYSKSHGESEACVTRLISQIMTATKCDAYELYIEEWRKDKKLFRRDMCSGYKIRKKKPGQIPFLNHARAFMVSKWNAKVVMHYEAEDVVLTRSRILKEEGDDTVVCFIDKDLLQYEGCFYNYQKQKMIVLDQDEADLRLWRQVCTGDQVDTIPGITGVGPVKAEKAIQDPETAMQDAVKLYKYNTQTYEYFILQYNLIKLREYEGVDLLYPLTEEEYEQVQ